MEWLALWGAIFTLSHLAGLRSVAAVDVHVQSDSTGRESDPVLLFRAGNGDGWSYHVDRGLRRQGIHQVLSLDATSGNIYLYRKHMCRQISRNPTQIRIVARSHLHDSTVTSSNYTITPLTIYFHNLPCDIPFSRKNERLDFIHVIIYSERFSYWNSVPCLEKETNLFQLSRFIPAVVNSSMLCDVIIDQSIYSYNTTDSSLTTNSVQCLQGAEISIPLQLKLCKKSQEEMISVKISIHDVPTNELTVKTNLKHSNRLRRQTSTAPAFEKSEYETSVSENQAAGKSVIQIIATDSDEGEAGKITYELSSIRDSRSNDMFSINAKSGLVTTTVRLDRELIAQHHLRVTAFDNSPGGQRSSYATLIIDVDDENDHSPSFDKKIYSVSKAENLVVTSTITTIRATDDDIEDNAKIRYSIIQPVGQTTFKIDPTKGSISTLRVLDRETTANYRLIVQAKDQAPFGKQLSSTATIEITVTDENDNYPQFDQRLYTVNVSENMDVSSRPPIGRVSATDADEGANQRLTYSITGGNNDNTFSIDSSTGIVSVQKPLNYEKEASYSLKIKASDDGVEAKTNSTTMWIQILDLNDNPPVFQSSQYKGRVLENEDVGTSVLTVVALDDDSGINEEMEYSIVDAPVGLPFSINGDSGKISLRSTVDREIQESYTFTVMVKDKGEPPLSATATVEVTIKDINDNSPIFAQKIFPISILENTSPNKQIFQLTAKDADKDSLITYVIVSGNIDNTFSIGEDNGIITLMKSLNYKIQSRYILTIRASDRESKFDTAEVHINVTDINKATPTFQNAPYRMNVDEEIDVGKSIGRVFAIDTDVGNNGKIRYDMVNDVPEFSLNPITGEITTREKLDRENTAGYSFDVRASDHGNPVRSDTAGVTVNVNDKNDNEPKFDQPLGYEANVGEDAKEGRPVITVEATDSDYGINKQLKYQFASGSDGMAYFELDEATGIIRVKAELDRETRNNFTLTILAVDGGFIPLTGSVEVKIKIDDVNDNAPQFASKEIIAMVSENKKIGSTVAIIEADDPDEGANAVIEYAFDGGPDADKFVLHNRPGDPAIIINHVDLDYESNKKEYIIDLKASSGHLFSVATIKLQLQDINDNEPVLKDFMIIFNNYIDHFPYEPIGRIPAHDPDVSDQDKLRYSFLLGNEAGFLDVNETSGEITLDSRLNSDVPRNGTIQVKVSDGPNDVTATCQLYVRLVTMEMLKSSVTIRINNMSSSAFLSPLFTFFVNALTTILNVEKDNIFVINVKNDTDVDAEILNVTVSVREKTVQMGREKVDVFYNAEFLQEQIYLQRTLLANLSTLQILPFDDNLCLREPCYGHGQCLSVMRFGHAAPFITSDTMLFRPISPFNGYDCDCPQGFTTSNKKFPFLCEVEVNMCFSKPCNNSATCIPREGGYTCQCTERFIGKHCEIDVTQKFQQTACPTDVCQPPSHCQPLIEGGFRCEGCPNTDHHNQFCQLTTRSFPRGSFLMFPTIKSRYRLSVQLKFATQHRNGLLFYNGRFNEKHDFIALEIIDGQVQLSFSLGANVTKVTPYVVGGVSDGQWHKVTVDYLNKTATVAVGEECDPEISIRFGRPINYKCADRATSAKLNCSQSCHLDLTGPLQIGGLPNLPSNFQIQNKGFVGCMKDFYLDGTLLDFNRSLANNGTEPGCLAKANHCAGTPCKNGGTCLPGWGTYICACRQAWALKDCSQAIDPPRKLTGSGYLYYNHKTSTLNRVHQGISWYNGVSFRTRASSGTLLFIVAESAEFIILELVDGFLQYTYMNSNDPQVYKFDTVSVNDGHWHYVEVRWESNGDIIFILDHGQHSKRERIQSSLTGKQILDVYVGAIKFGTDDAEKFFHGCVQNIRVGNSEDSLLYRPEINNATEGCSSENACRSNPCSSRAQCVSEWEGYSCNCPPGTLGPECESICTNYNPCQNMAYCHHSPGSSYSCDCGKLQSGKYCEVVAVQPCPEKWWGYPLCGPCDKNCTLENGFNPSCDQVTGKCSCLANYYRPPGSRKCLPCQCYPHGSRNLQCHGTTGECPCIKGVMGQRCNQCPSEYAEIRMDEKTGLYGCKIDYQACPRIFSHGMWWDTEVANVMVVQGCPDGAVGTAQRNCSADGLWREPDMFNCTSRTFVDHVTQLERIESGTVEINTFVAKTTMASLANSTSHTEQLYGNDLNVTLRLMNVLLDYENRQFGLNLTSEQDSKYVANMLTVMSDILIPKYAEEWNQLNKEGEGTHRLIMRLETYLSRLLSALELISTVSTRPYNVVTENIVLSVDMVGKRNYSGVTIPKYDNIVRSPSFDDDTSIHLPASILTQAPLTDFLRPDIVASPKAYVGHILYRHLGDLLPRWYGTGVRVLEERPMSVNSPVLTILVRDDGRDVTGPLKQPVEITFKQLLTENRASPQCVYWQNATKGGWTMSGCQETGRYAMEGKLFVTCSCRHMSSFAVLMDISDTEYVPSEPVTVEIITFIGLIICMGCLAKCFIVFICFKKLYSNFTNIHANLVLVFFLSQLGFLTGIDRTETKIGCRVVAIWLHYFFMCGFSWLYVDILHIYRMLTEIRNIDQGTMKFYYLLGYVIPGIVVSLSVGLNTEGYGNHQFCWLEMADKFIWSFAGPITLCIIINIFTFVLALKASCQEKVCVADITPLRFGMLGNIVVLMLWGILWILGLLSVNYNYTVLHYLYAIFSLALGVFIVIIYLIINSQVRVELKKLWYRCQGKKLDLEDNIAGTRSSLYSRSALAYRNDSCDGVLNRINVGISTTSTTSRSTSKSSGGIYKGEDYLRSTSTSTSGNIPPAKYPKKGSVPAPYGYDADKPDDLDAENVQIRPKRDGNDSDSDSEMSERVSLDLASSHSSDDEDEIGATFNWENQLPKNKKIEEAKEQVRQLKEEQQQQQQQKQQQQQQLQGSHDTLPALQHHYHNPFEQIYSGSPSSRFSPKPSQPAGHWPGDPQLSGYNGSSDSEARSSEQPTLSSMQPDVTLQTPEYKGREFINPALRHTPSLVTDSNSSVGNGPFSPPTVGSPNLKHSPRGVPQPFTIERMGGSSPVKDRLGSPVGSPRDIVGSPQRDRMMVKVLTHRGSVSSESELFNTCIVQRREAKRSSNRSFG